MRRNYEKTVHESTAFMYHCLSQVILKRIEEHPAGHPRDVIYLNVIAPLKKQFLDNYLEGTTSI